MPCRKAAIGEPEGKRNVILQMRQIATVKISGGKFNVVEKVQIIGIAIIPTTTLLIILVAMILKIIKIAKNITVPCPAKSRHGQVKVLCNLFDRGTAFPKALNFLAL